MAAKSAWTWFGTAAASTGWATRTGFARGIRRAFAVESAWTPRPGPPSRLRPNRQRRPDRRRPGIRRAIAVEAAWSPRPGPPSRRRHRQRRPDRCRPGHPAGHRIDRRGLRGQGLHRDCGQTGGVDRTGVDRGIRRAIGVERRGLRGQGLHRDGGRPAASTGPASTGASCGPSQLSGVDSAARASIETAAKPAASTGSATSLVSPIPVSGQSRLWATVRRPRTARPSGRPAPCQGLGVDGRGHARVAPVPAFAMSSDRPRRQRSRPRPSPRLGLSQRS